MNTAAILVMWPIWFEQTLVIPTHWGSVWNLAFIGRVISEEWKFEESGRRKNGRTDDGHSIL